MISKGDKLLCIRGGEGDDCYPSIKEGNFYIANEFYPCPCGAVGVDIGFEWKIKPHSQTCSCGRLFPPDPAPAYNINRFVKIEPEYKVVEVTSEIKEKRKDLVLQ